MKKHTGKLVAYLNDVTRQAAATPDAGYTVRQIDVTKIIPNEKNFYSITGIEELANSLSVSDRQLPPLDVVDNGDGTYRLISGERRLSAMLFRIERGEMKRAELPCHVLPNFRQEGNVTAEQMETLSIILANNYRQKTTLDRLREVQELEPIARAIYQEEKEKGTLSDGSGKNTPFRTFFAEQILAISPAALQRLKTLENLSESAADAFEEGLLSKSVATELAALSKEEQDGFIASIRAGECAGTRTDLESYLQGGDSDHEDEAEELYTEDRPLRAEVFDTTHESPAADVTFEEAEESPQEERHSAYDVTNASAPIMEIHAADTATDEIVSVKDDTDSSNIYGQTEEKSVETSLEEVEGQERLPITEEQGEDSDEQSASQRGSATPSGERMTHEEASEILVKLQIELGKKDRHREVLALTMAQNALCSVDDLRDYHES